jgi:ribose transport system ATP-binding protein
VGAGRSELARLVFGADRKRDGRIFLDGREIAPESPHQAIREGIGLLTEDRNRYGLIMQMSIRENISLANLRAMLTGPFIDRGKEEAAARRLAADLRIKAPGTGVIVETLSGGNRQKVVLARWLNTKARVLIFDEPTAGIDVGVKFEIYTLINRLAEQGIGVIVISSDLPELLGICHRVAVMCEGRLTGVVEGSRSDAGNRHDIRPQETSDDFTRALTDSRASSGSGSHSSWNSSSSLSSPPTSSRRTTC